MMNSPAIQIFFIILSASPPIKAWTTTTYIENWPSRSVHAKSTTALRSNAIVDSSVAGDDWREEEAHPLAAGAGDDRRSFLADSSATAAAVALSAIVGSYPSFAEDEEEGGIEAAPLQDESTPSSATLSPFCVIGANGRTGCECVGALVERGIPVRATSRSGTYVGTLGLGSKLVAEMACDVTEVESISPAVRGTSAVIFAASASKNGGPPSAVDNAGLVSVAEACLAEGVPHLVVVSSGGVTKPSSPVYMFLNLLGNIMQEKVLGEDAVRSMYARYNRAAGVGGGGATELAYTIIRPGGLTTEPARGVTALELNQGDNKSGRISRADVAALCVEAVRYPQFTSGTTFECYDADTGAPLASVGLSNIMKAKTDDKVFVSGRECRGETWGGLFSGLERD